MGLGECVFKNYASILAEDEEVSDDGEIATVEEGNNN